MAAARAKRRTVYAILGAIGAMLGLVVYSPTLYALFCEITGAGGTTQRGAAAPNAVGDRVFVIRFTSDTHPNLPWRFGPAEREIRVRVGEERLAHYVAENMSKEGVTGTAIYNVAPLKAGQYFNKIACFCFEEQYLAPGQRVDMPVSFFVDPAILKDRAMDDVREITLSYTFYRSQPSKRRAQAPAPGGGSAN
jgi:cytochrome c oxidase assembly protein subunit 11